MAGWAGFTDEDLRQLKQSSPHVDAGERSENTAHKQAMIKKHRLQQQQRDLLARQRAQDFAQPTGVPIPASQRLASASPKEVMRPMNPGGIPEKTNTKNAAESGSKGEGTQAAAAGAKDGGDRKQDAIREDALQNGPAVEEVKELDEKAAINLEMSRVDQFRIQQQKMEEENKQRRQLLADAIKQRSRMAKAEAEKLTKVQKELSHLDSLVTADVSIIRDRIEAASMEFLQAQKRYERAEREFVEAKLALAEKSELKESLTEHLYTIIQQNEARKAQRLAILMKELGLAAHDCPASTAIPPLLSFSPINTFLHRSGLSPTSPTSPQPEVSHSSERSSTSSKQAASASTETESPSSSSKQAVQGTSLTVNANSSPALSETVTSQNVNAENSTSLIGDAENSVRFAQNFQPPMSKVANDQLTDETSSPRSNQNKTLSKPGEGTRCEEVINGGASITPQKRPVNSSGDRDSPSAADGAVEQNTKSKMSTSSSVNQESPDGGAEQERS